MEEWKLLKAPPSEYFFGAKGATCGAWASCWMSSCFLQHVTASWGAWWQTPAACPGIFLVRGPVSAEVVQFLMVGITIEADRSINISRSVIRGGGDGDGDGQRRRRCPRALNYHLSKSRTWAEDAAGDLHVCRGEMKWTVLCWLSQTAAVREHLPHARDAQRSYY